MLRLRRNLVKLVLQLVIFALAAAAFLIAGYIRFGAGLFFHVPGSFDLRAYLVLLFFASISWAFLSSQAGLAKPQRFFAAGGKTRKIAGACATTYVVTLVATFFYREAQFSRAFVILSCICLFVLTGICQILFRFVLE